MLAQLGRDLQSEIVVLGIEFGASRPSQEPLLKRRPINHSGRFWVFIRMSRPNYPTVKNSALRVPQTSEGNFQPSAMLVVVDTPRLKPAGSGFRLKSANSRQGSLYRYVSVRCTVEFVHDVDPCYS